MITTIQHAVLFSPCSIVLLVFQEEQETSYTILRARGCNVTLNGLKPNTAYLLQIRARTAAGYGASSPSFQFETSPDCKLSTELCADNLSLYFTITNGEAMVLKRKFNGIKSF